MSHTHERPRPTPHHGLMGTLTGIAPLSEEMRKAPRARQEAKVKSSVLGLIIAGFALLLFLAVFLIAAFVPGTDKWVLLGGAVTAAVLLAFGALVADRETVWPALVGIVTLLRKGRKAVKE